MTEKEAGAVLIIENGEIQKLLGHSSIIENMVYMGLDGMYFKPEKPQIVVFKRNLRFYILLQRVRESPIVLK